MCSSSFYEENFLPWLHDPNKNWFKLIKFILTIVRGLILLVFVGLTIYLVPQNIVFPKVALICLLIINWRFIISCVLVAALVCAKLIEIVSFCFCVGCVTHPCLVGFEKLTKSSLVGLNWSHFDWPCFRNLKYYVYYVDTAHYLVYLVAVVVVFFVEVFALNSNVYLSVVFVTSLVPLGAHLIVELVRILQSRRVEQTIRDIFNADVAFSPKAKSMISENQLGSFQCGGASFASCSLIDSHHRALAHPKEVFTREFKDVSYNKKGVNLTIGFHQTTIEASKSILTSGFRPSKSGMLGPGIYFATNYDATDFKRNQSTEGGAIFCAVLDMGRVYELVADRTDTHNHARFFNSKYLHHGAGHAYDEFVVYAESQVLEYTIIVEQAAIDSFRHRNKRRFCDCI